MESAHPTPRANRIHSGVVTARTRPGNGRESSRIGATPRAADENCSPANVPKGLEGMLKTTTETGDIGMFSIKPSRLPHGHTTPRRTPRRDQASSQKPRQLFQPYGVPANDDRRHLPSYTRDMTSEVVSVYETASQKSGSRVSDGPDSRSYSMTQTSYSAYTLSNHRSYASLRSQIEVNGPIQRPRSPFAYPARLKRPGFRPSSPALTDGGLIDYSRRAEIDRNGFGHSTSSPSSLYAQKRKPPLSLRQEGNRSTPSLLSQSSPPRRISSPYIPHSNCSLRNESFHRNGLSSVHTSPARSTFSLASTVNLYAPAPSAASTPGKLLLSTPLYYDYTEDFYIEDDLRRTALNALPQFHIVQTPAEAKALDAKETSITLQEVSSTYKPIKPPSSVLEADPVSSLGQKAKGIEHQQEIVSGDDVQLPLGTTISKTDRKVFRLSGLGYDVRELKHHVEEAFGLFPSPSFELSLHQSGTHSSETDKDSLKSEVEKDQQQYHARSSSSSLTSDIKRLPLLARDHTKLHALSAFDDAVPRATNHIGAGQEVVQTSGIPENHTQHIKQRQQLQSDDEKASQSALPRTRVRSSGFTSIAAGLTELDEFVRNMDSGSGMAASSSIPPGRTPMASPTIPNESVFLRISSSDKSISPPASFMNEAKIGSNIAKMRHIPHKDKRLDLRSIPDNETSTVQIIGLQIPRKYGPRSESPMLAPKPISPARQLKLKNSIPHLMKALPPLPREPQVRAVNSQSNPPLPEFDLPCRLSPLLLDNPSPSVNEPYPTADPSPTFHKTRIIDSCYDGARVPGFEVFQIENMASMTSPPKMKLRMKHVSTARPVTPSVSRPWNLDESYPWSQQDPEVRMPSADQEKKPRTPKQPKFKLKITRATNSTEGTIRVHRDSADSKSPGSLHLPNPKDLFTPSGLDNIFRQVSRHIHARNGGTGSSHRWAQQALLADQPDGHELPPPLTPANALGIFETRSGFSDDSSQVPGHQGLREIISSLKARIAAPYASKVAAHSFDDISWRDRNAPQTRKSPATRSSLSLQNSRKETEASPMRRLASKGHRQHLKGKMLAWIRGARSRITARMRSQGPTKSRSNDTLFRTHDS